MSILRFLRLSRLPGMLLAIGSRCTSIRLGWAAKFIVLGRSLCSTRSMIRSFLFTRLTFRPNPFQDPVPFGRTRGDQIGTTAPQLILNTPSYRPSLLPIPSRPIHLELVQSYLREQFPDRCGPPSLVVPPFGIMGSGRSRTDPSIDWSMVGRRC